MKSVHTPVRVARLAPAVAAAALHQVRPPDQMGEQLLTALRAAGALNEFAALIGRQTVGYVAFLGALSPSRPAQAFQIGWLATDRRTAGVLAELHRGARLLMGEDTQNALFVGWSRRAEEYGQLHKGAVVMEDEKRFVPRPAKRGFLIVAEVINAIAGFDALPRALRAAVLGAVYDDRAVLDALLRYKPVRVVRTPDGQGLIAYRSGRRGVRVLACTPSAPGLTEALMDAACRDIGAEGCAWTGHRVASIAPERLERREVSVGTLFAPPGPESGRVTTPMAAEMGDRFPHVVRF